MATRWFGVAGFAAGVFALLGHSETASAEGGSLAPVLWGEHFDREPLDWLDPFKHSGATLARVYKVEHLDGSSFLHARYDGEPSSRPPAIDFGRAFQTGAPRLDKVATLSWRWRAITQPNVSKDPWLDMAASVYVVIRTPSMMHGGRGFKFGWLAKPGPSRTYQHGLLQIAQRTDPPSGEWRSESVDLCALYRNEYGPCEGEHVLFVGVVTDGDNTHSLAEADYTDFSLVGSP